MKLFTFIGLFALIAGVGCQTASSTTDNQSDSATAAKIVNNPPTESAPNNTDGEDTDSHEATEEAPRMLVEDAKKAFDEGNAFFIDTRGASIYENEHVRGAINIPASDIENRFEEVPKNKTIVVYCS